MGGRIVIAYRMIRKKPAPFLDVGVGPGFP